MSNEGALANLDIDSALAEIASGVLSKQIAQRFNCTPRAVRYALQRARPEEYKLAVAEQAESIVDDAMDYLNQVREMGNVELIPIARACADTAFKYAAARDPARWGNRSQLDVTVNHVLADKLRQAERVIEHDATQQIEQINGETGQE